MPGSIDPQLALQIVAQENHPIAYDTETSGLTVRDFICGYVITNSSDSVYIPVRHRDGGNIPAVDDFEAALNKAFEERSRNGYRTVGHNLGFDLRASLRHGVKLWSPLEDTMINEGLIDDRYRAYSLDATARRHGVTLKLGDELYQEIARRFGGLPDRTSMKNFWQMPGDHPLVVDYATGDGVSTLEVWERQQVILDEENLRQCWQIECDLLPYLARIHHRGVKVDLDYADRVTKHIADTIALAKEKFPPGFNSRSPKEVEALFRAHGYTDNMFATTEGGRPSFTEKWLEGNDIGQAIVEIRQLANCESKFVIPMSQTHCINGRLHPVLHQSKSDDFGVAGSRLSCSDPNLQAVTKRNKKLGKIVRPLIIPDDGMLLGEPDFSQQEPRLFTHFSGDPDLIEGYRNGTMDMHDRASALLQLDRSIAKRLSMGMLTMMSAKTLAMHMGWEYSKAKAARAEFLYNAFPKIKEFQDLARKVFKDRGYVKSILGRRARFESVKLDYQAISRIIQNSGGEHMKAAMLQACKFEDAYPSAVQILLSIHDSLPLQFDPGQRHLVKQMIDELDQIASRPPFNLAVPIPMEFAFGKNWGEASYAEEVKNVRNGWLGEWRDL